MSDMQYCSVLAFCTIVLHVTGNFMHETFWVMNVILGSNWEVANIIVLWCMYYQVHSSEWCKYIVRDIVD